MACSASSWPTWCARSAPSRWSGDTTRAQFTLMAFGGAGPLHARDVALALGIREILVPAVPGILCAQGLIVSDLKEDFVASERIAGDAAGHERLAGHVDALTARACAWFDAEGVPARSRRFDLAVDARYVGQNFELAVPIATQSQGDPAGAAGLADRAGLAGVSGPVASAARRGPDSGPLPGCPARAVPGGPRVGLRVCEPARSDRDRQREAYRPRPAARRARSPRVRRTRPAPRAVRAPDGVLRARGRDRLPRPRTGVAAAGEHAGGSGNRRAARLHHSHLSHATRRSWTGRAISSSASPATTLPEHEPEHGHEHGHEHAHEHGQTHGTGRAAQSIRSPWRSSPTRFARSPTRPSSR